ncbi:uncharacterized protein ELE39_003737 [Cryptosporidium sp. chipmunk genotype I]|uniref:uncharacterized protein n=1 Tax=Cryptosporidium sp. chipmunk genotype I TaxID=1280935 RepID=UPI003519FFE8|nr:hypothetical protein ELE39_003737 [Cryptosporidium sp. chipmunk genotype I]
MNFGINYKLCLGVESKIEIELEKNQRSETENLIFSESRFYSLIEVVCKSFNVIDDVRTLISILKLYSGRVFACSDSLNTYNGCLEYIRPQLFLLLRKNWVISIGICTRIAQLEDAFIENFSKYCALESSKDTLSYLSCLLPLFLIFSKSKINRKIILDNFKEKLSFLDEIKLISRFRFLKLIENKKYIYKQTEEIRDINSAKTENKKFIPKLESEINLLNTLEQKTCAVLNMITFDDKGSGNDKILGINNYRFIFNLWDEYSSIGSEELLIIEIIESKNLPSICLKCEILFIITTYIKETSTFEKVIKLIISNTSQYHKIMHYICSRWHSLLGKDRIDFFSENLPPRAIEECWKNVRALIWEFQVLIPLFSKNVTYFNKIQSIALSYYLISYFVQVDEVIYDYSQEVEFIYKLFQVLSDEIINVITKDSVLYSFALERSVLPRISAFSENTIFSNNLFNLISNVATVDLGNDVNKAVYYQLVSNLLCDPYIKRQFSLGTESGKINVFLEIFDLHKLTMTNNLTKFIYLFGQIPSEIITSTSYKTSINYHFDLPFLNTFSPRVVKNSPRYYNSIRFTETFSKVIKNISQSRKTNIKVILLFLIDFIKRLYKQHIADLRGKIVNQDRNANGQADFYYSYIVLFKYLNHCFEKYNNYVDEHVTMALKSIAKPELIIPKNVIFVF